MSVYSKAYQTVIAGRTREDEAIAFYGKNKIALPARVTNFVSMGGQTQPTIVEQANELARQPQIRPPLVTGDDLTALGMAPGPAMGALAVTVNSFV